MRISDWSSDLCSSALNPQLRTRATSASREHVPLPSWRTALLTAGVLIGASAVLAGILTDSDALRVTRILGLALVAISLVPLVGFGGQVSLCQMSFAAIGAVVMAHHGQAGDPLALLLAQAVCALVRALVALPALARTRAVSGESGAVRVDYG